MPFGGFERHGGTRQPMSEINVTPLVDVMLVLLVIFIITAPLLSYAIRLDLPNDVAPAVRYRPGHGQAVDRCRRAGLLGRGPLVDDDQLRTRLADAGRHPRRPNCTCAPTRRHATNALRSCCLPRSRPG